MPAGGGVDCAAVAEGNLFRREQVTGYGSM